MDILQCDKCGFQLTEKDEIALALDGADAWRAGCKSRGVEARGLFPCKNYIRCKGEMIVTKYKKPGKNDKL